MTNINLIYENRIELNPPGDNPPEIFMTGTFLPESSEVLTCSAKTEAATADVLKKKYS